MERKNCWEVLKCGREPNGEKADDLGICPAALPNKFNGANNGKQAGRFCWAIAGTLCEGKVSGTYAQKLKDCLDCHFLKQVNEEEGGNFTLTINNYKKIQYGDFTGINFG